MAHSSTTTLSTSWTKRPFQAATAGRSTSGPRLGLKFAVCLEGQNACPPEDCGGPSGYRAMLQALDDPNDEEHESYLRWVGGPFDPTYFEVAEANAALQRVR